MLLAFLWTMSLAFFQSFHVLGTQILPGCYTDSVGDQTLSGSAPLRWIGQGLSNHYTDLQKFW